MAVRFEAVLVADLCKPVELQEWLDKTDPTVVYSVTQVDNLFYIFYN